MTDVIQTSLYFTLNRSVSLDKMKITEEIIWGVHSASLRYEIGRLAAGILILDK